MAVHTAELQLPTDDPAADGHFPGNPIVPGAVLLREIARALSVAGTSICYEIPSARFLHPVRPGDRLTIIWETKLSGEIGFTGAVGSRRVLTGSMRMRAR